MSVTLILLNTLGWGTLDFTGVANNVPEWRVEVTLTYLDQDSKVREFTYHRIFTAIAEEEDAVISFFLGFTAHECFVHRSADAKRLTIFGQPGWLLRGIKYETFTRNATTGKWVEAPELKAPGMKGSSPTTKVIINPRRL